MATFNKFNVFTTDLAKGYHQFGTHTFKFMLVAQASAPAATNTIKGNLTEIASGAGYTQGAAGLAITMTPTNSTGTTCKVTATDPTVVTATGTMATFRYVVIYNDSQTSPVKPLVAWYDYGSDVTLLTGETFAVDFDDTNGFFTIA